MTLMMNITINYIFIYYIHIIHFKMINIYFKMNNIYFKKIDIKRN